MTVISTILAPPDCPQRIQMPPKATAMGAEPALDRDERRIVAAIPSTQPIGIWPLLNGLSKDQDWRTRKAHRLDLWHSLKGLLHRRVIHRYGRTAVCREMPDPSALKVAEQRARRRPTVHDRAVKMKGSTDSTPRTKVRQNPSLSVDIQLPSAQAALPPNRTNIEIEAKPSQEQIAEAARSLRSLRGRKKNWTGWINGVHAYKDMEIILPNGRRAFVFGVLRGKVVWTPTRGSLPGEFPYAMEWGVIPADQVKVVPNQSASLLGKLKRGVRERPSAAKARAARENGRRPCRAGRKRGRPRRKSR